jgi:hypothetical protein
MPYVNIVEINPYAPLSFVFADLARVLVSMFARLGCITGHYLNTVPQQGTSVILGWSPTWLAENNDMLKGKNIILVNAEQLATKSVVVSKDYLACLKEWHVAEYHASNTPFLNKFFILPIIPSNAVLYELEPSTKDIDILFYGSMNDRRSKIISNIIATGVNVHVANGIYGYDLAPLISRSHIVLHMHYYETKLFPIIRFLQPIMQQVPIVCEVSNMSPHNDWTKSGIVFAEYDKLTLTCLMLLANKKQQQEVAASTLQFANSMRVGQGLKHILEG